MADAQMVPMPPDRLPAVLEVLDIAPTNFDRKSMLIIQVAHTVPVEVTIDWLRQVLPSDAFQQVREASLVMISDPAMRLAKIVKLSFVSEDDYLEIHTAAMG